MVWSQDKNIKEHQSKDFAKVCALLTWGSKPMVPRPAAVTDTVLPSLPTLLMSTMGTLADPAVDHHEQCVHACATKAGEGASSG